MTNILGIYISSLPYPILNQIGTLLYDEYPSTIILSDDENIPYVLEWVDCSDDNLDRFILFKSDISSLKRFIHNDISHYELIESSFDGNLIIFDGSLEAPENILITSINKVPKDYLPSYDSKFKRSDGVDTLKIESFFSLDILDISEDEEYIDSAIKLGNKYNSEVFNLHLKKGNGIGFGRANTFTLGDSLIKLDDLYKQVGFDFYGGLDRNFEIKSKNDIYNETSTEVFHTMAASFSVFIRPVSYQFSIFEKKTNNDYLIDRIFELFESSQNSASLTTIFNHYSNFVYNSYINLLKSITEHHLTVSYKWYSPFNKRFLQKDINFNKAYEILNILNNFEKKELINISITGQLRELNIETGHYKFLSNQNDYYTGYFDSMLMDNITFLTFIDLYDVEIEKTTIHKINKDKPEINYKIVSCIKQ